jgi:DNA-directed RNA polymerase specialized sigma subunit
MKAKQYLSQFQAINLKLRNMTRQVQSLEDALENANPVINAMPRPATLNIHRMEDLIAAKIDLEKQIENETVKLAEITRTVNLLQSDHHIAILTNRYFCRMEWSDIACELYVSVGRVYQLHREALLEIEKSIADYS